VQPQASAACAEVPHGGLLVCHAQATGPEPGAQEALGCDGFGVGGPEDHAVSGVPHSRVGPTAHACRGLGHPQGVFHARPGDVEPSWPDHPTRRAPGCRGRPHRCFHLPGVSPWCAHPPGRDVAHGLCERGMSDVMECACAIGLAPPGAGGVRPGPTAHVFDGVVPSWPRATPVTAPCEAGVPKRFQGVVHPGLDTAIDHGGHAKRTCPVPLRDRDPPDRRPLGQIAGAALVAPRPALCRRRHPDGIHAGCRRAAVPLGDAPPAGACVRPAFPPQSLQRPAPGQLAWS
jgi:hypothetical protein